MISFLNWLYENVDFAKGKDQDYPSDDKRVLVFSEKEPEEYTVQGQTHGEMSHSIKHMSEYDKDFVEKVCADFRKDVIAFLRRKPEAFCRIYNGATKKFSPESGIAAVEKSITSVCLNTFDLINDRMMENQSLNKFDHIAKKYATILMNKYDGLISGKMEKAFDMDASKMSPEKLLAKVKPLSVVSFKSRSRAGVKRVYLDFGDRSIIISSDRGTVNTMFRLDCENAKKNIVARCFNKGFVPNNPDIEQVLKKL